METLVEIHLCPSWSGGTAPGLGQEPGTGPPRGRRISAPTIRLAIRAHVRDMSAAQHGEPLPSSAPAVRGWDPSRLQSVPWYGGLAQATLDGIISQEFHRRRLSPKEGRVLPDNFPRQFDLSREVPKIKRGRIRATYERPSGGTRALGEGPLDLALRLPGQRPYCQVGAAPERTVPLLRLTCVQSSSHLV
jgi:hypothetical protein